MTEQLPISKEIQALSQQIQSANLEFFQGGKFSYEGKSKTTHILDENLPPTRGEIILTEEGQEISLVFPGDFLGTELIIQAIHDPKLVTAAEEFYSMKTWDWKVNGAYNKQSPFPLGQILGYRYETPDSDVLVCGGPMTLDKWDRSNSVLLKLRLNKGAGKKVADLVKDNPQDFLQSFTDAVFRKDGHPITKNPEIEVRDSIYGSPDTDVFAITKLTTLAIHVTTHEVVTDWKNRLKISDALFC